MSKKTSWYYSNSAGVRVGPVSTSKLNSLISKGLIPTNSLAWKKGMDEWTALNEIPDLEDLPPVLPEVLQTAVPTLLTDPDQTESSWYYTNNNGERAGPVSADKLNSLVSKKLIRPSNLAWKKGMANWKAITHIPDLQDSPSSPSKEPEKKQAAQSKKPWHYTDNAGLKVGPVSTSKLNSLISKRLIPANSLVWKKGMDEWTALNEIEELQELPPSLPEIFQTAAPAAAVDPQKKSTPKPKKVERPTVDFGKYDGIRRLNYFLRSLLLSVGVWSLISFTSLSGYFEKAASFESLSSLNLTLGGLGFLATALCFLTLIAIPRIKNIGLHSWWAILLLAPLINIILGIALISLPEGYAHHRKTDIPAIILLLGSILLCIAFFFLEHPLSGYRDSYSNTLYKLF